MAARLTISSTTKIAMIFGTVITQLGTGGGIDDLVELAVALAPHELAAVEDRDHQQEDRRSRLRTVLIVAARVG